MQWQSGRYEAKHKSGGWLPGLQHPCIHPSSLSTKCFTISQAAFYLVGTKTVKFAHRRYKQALVSNNLYAKGYLWFSGSEVWSEKSRGTANPCHPSEIEGGSHRLTDPPLCPNKSSLLWPIGQLGNWKASVFKNWQTAAAKSFTFRCLGIQSSP